MIRHICMFKLKEENKEQNFKEIFDRVQSLKEISKPYCFWKIYR